MARPSRVRDAIERLVGESSRHDWSIDEVLAALRRRRVAADPSSVFRGLTHLERSGVVRRVDLGDGRARFEAMGGHHDHVRCDGCGEVVAVPACPVGAEQAAVARATGWSITGHRLLFVGSCPDCAAGAGRAR